MNANYEGISSTASILIEGGDIRIMANEDGLNANTDGTSHIGISGGYLYVHSAHGDGIDSNGTLTFDGGTVVSLGSLEDLSGGFDADGPVTINGGTIIATGAHMPAPAVTSPQRAILALFGAAQPANQLVSIQSQGAPLLTFAPAAAYDRVFLSSSEIADGVLYDVYLGGSASGNALDGVYRDGTYSGGTHALTVTTESTHY